MRLELSIYPGSQCGTYCRAKLELSLLDGIHLLRKVFEGAYSALKAKGSYKLPVILDAVKIINFQDTLKAGITNGKGTVTLSLFSPEPPTRDVV